MERRVHVLVFVCLSVCVSVCRWTWRVLGWFWYLCWIVDYCRAPIVVICRDRFSRYFWRRFSQFLVPRHHSNIHPLPPPSHPWHACVYNCYWSDGDVVVVASETLYCVLMLPVKLSMLLYISRPTLNFMLLHYRGMCYQLSHTRVQDTHRWMRTYTDSLHASKCLVPTHTCINYTAAPPPHDMSPSSSSTMLAAVREDVT